jgi:hypothetical protein
MILPSVPHISVRTCIICSIFLTALMLIVYSSGVVLSEQMTTPLRAPMELRMVVGVVDNFTSSERKSLLSENLRLKPSVTTTTAFTTNTTFTEVVVTTTTAPMITTPSDATTITPAPIITTPSDATTITPAPIITTPSDATTITPAPIITTPSDATTITPAPITLPRVANADLHQSCEPLHHEEHGYFEVYTDNSFFVAYLRVEGDTLQLARFEPTTQKGVYRARYEVYKEGQRNSARVLVLFNHSLEVTSYDSCTRNVEIEHNYTERWISSIKRSSGWHWTVNASGVPLYQVEEGESHHSVDDGVDSHISKVCFFGDSQTRNNAFWLFPDCSGLKTMWDSCPRCKYHQMSYGQDFLNRQSIWGDATLCPVVILNFGQWDLSWVMPYMTKFEDYENEVARVLKAYLQVRHPSSLVWATLNPMGLPERCAHEWRFLNNIEEYNARALPLAKQFNVSIWDTYSALKHVYDRSYDGWHYRLPEAVRPSLLEVLLEKEILLK